MSIFSVSQSIFISNSRYLTPIVIPANAGI